VADVRPLVRPDSTHAGDPLSPMSTHDIAAKKLYELLDQDRPKDRDWTPIPWEQADEGTKNKVRAMVQLVAENTLAPIDGEVLVRLPGMHGVVPIKHVFRCDITEGAINAACVEIQDWLLELTKGMRA